jgi:hypothetical protein
MPHAPLDFAEVPGTSPSLFFLQWQYLLAHHPLQVSGFSREINQSCDNSVKVILCSSI